MAAADSLGSLAHLQIDGTSGSTSDSTELVTSKKMTPPKKRRTTTADRAYKPDNDASEPDDHIVTKRRASRGKAKAADSTPPQPKSNATAAPLSDGTGKKSKSRLSSGKRKSASAAEPIQPADSAPLQKKAKLESADVTAEVNGPDDVLSEPGDRTLTKRDGSNGKANAVKDTSPQRKQTANAAPPPDGASKDSTPQPSSRKRKSASAPELIPTADPQISQKRAKLDSQVESERDESESNSPSLKRRSRVDAYASDVDKDEDSAESLNKSVPTQDDRKTSDPSSTTGSNAYDHSENSVSEYAASEDGEENRMRKSKSPDRRPSQKNYRPGSTGEDDEEDEVTEPSAERVQREAHQNALQRAAHARMAEREARRLSEFNDLKPQEYQLFATIDHRGFESFLPLAWHLDFPYKVDVFFGETPDTTHINSVDFTNSNANFRAIRALANLIKIGPTVRDRYRIMGRRPEPWIRKQIHTYMEWAERDARYGGVGRVPRVLSVAFDDSASGSESGRVVKRLERRMRRSAGQWRRWLHDNPDLQAGEGDGRRAGDRQEADGASTRARDRGSSAAEAADRGDEKEAAGANTREDAETKGRGPRAQVGRRLSSIFQWALSLVGRGGEAEAEDESGGERERMHGFTPSTAIDCVYGIAVSHMVVAILSYRIYGDEGRRNGDDGDDEESEAESESGADDDAGGAAGEEAQGADRKKERRRARVIFYVDFAKPAEDVWNSVAVAMAVCHCRDVRLAQSQKLDRRDDDAFETEMEVDDDL